MKRKEKIIKENSRYVLTQVEDRKGYFNIWVIYKAGSVRDYSGNLLNDLQAQFYINLFKRKYLI